MSRKSTKRTQVKAESIGLGPGDIVSINLRSGSHFWLGDDYNQVFFLNRKNWHQVIPDDIAYSDLLKIKQAIATGRLIKGRVNTSKVGKNPAIKEHYNQILNSNTGPIPEKRLKDLIRTLVNSRTIEGYTPTEIINSMIGFERTHKNRPDILSYLSESYQYAKKTNNIHYEVETEEEEEVYLSEDNLDALIEKSKREMENEGIRVDFPRPTNEQIIESLWPS